MFDTKIKYTKIIQKLFTIVKRLFIKEIYLDLKLLFGIIVFYILKKKLKIHYETKNVKISHLIQNKTAYLFER